MNGFTRLPFASEMSKYMDIRDGDVESVKKTFAKVRKNFSEGKGKLSDDPIRNVRYHMIVSVAVIARVCVAGGMSHDEAYTLGDIYIRKADVCNDYEGILDIFDEMRTDYAKRMHELRKSNVISLHIRKCINYIYENLGADLSVKALAKAAELNPAYLSRLFRQETGIPLKRFVKEARVDTAQNLLRYSNLSYLVISTSLGFSTQSVFIAVFKEITGMTPKVYREKYYTKNR